MSQYIGMEWGLGDAHYSFPALPARSSDTDEHLSTAQFTPLTTPGSRHAVLTARVESGGVEGQRLVPQLPAASILTRGVPLTMTQQLFHFKRCIPYTDSCRTTDGEIQQLYNGLKLLYPDMVAKMVADLAADVFPKIYFTIGRTGHQQGCDQKRYAAVVAVDGTAHTILLRSKDRPASGKLPDVFDRMRSVEYLLPVLEERIGAVLRL